MIHVFIAVGYFKAKVVEDQKGLTSNASTPNLSSCDAHVSCKRAIGPVQMCSKPKCWAIRL